MPDQYSLKMRKLVYAYMITEGHTAEEAAVRWRGGRGPSLITLKRWEQQFILNGSYKLARGPNKKFHTRMGPVHVAMLGTIFTAEPRLYLCEAADLLEEAVGRRYDTSTISRVLRSPSPYGLGRSRQVLQRRAREADDAERRLFLDATRDLNPKQMIWVDESHCDPRSCNRKRGFLGRGVGRHHHVLENFGPTTKRYSLLAAANVDGFVFDACEAVEGGVDADRFVQWVTERLVPTLGRFDYGDPNSIVILDNASVHHSLLAIVKALFYEAGAIVIFLSPYSPDLNPIEQCFKHLKAFFKRNLSFNYAMLHLGLRTVTPQMMRAFCGHSGIVVEDPRVAAAALRRRRQLATLALLILS
jgi:transposase